MRINQITTNNMISCKQNIKKPKAMIVEKGMNTDKIKKQPFVIPEKIQKFAKKIVDIIINILDTF